MDSVFVWLAPAIAALLLYGVGQGLVKKYISEVPPARFCLYFVAAKACVNLWFYASHDHPALFDPANFKFLWTGQLAYILDGIGWIFYFQSIVNGPITIVGTLSAAYPATTVLFAWWFLGEILTPIQYLGVALVIVGCVVLAYAPADSGIKIKSRIWIPFAVGALIIWGISQTLVKYSYHRGANEVTMSFLNTVGGFLTLGMYGLLRGLKVPKSSGSHGRGEWLRSFLPMGMMAGGDLGVIIAARTGPISIVTPLTGAYPMVTVIFASFALKERILWFQWSAIALILMGMFLSPGASG